MWYTLKRATLSIGLAITVLAPPPAFATPNGAKKLPSDKLFESDNFYCGKIGNNWIPGRLITRGFFYPHNKERANILALANTAKGGKRSSLLNRAQTLKNQILERTATCNAGKPTPTPTPTPSAIPLTANSYLTCGINSSNIAKCWGWNPYGAVGDETTTDRNTATTVNNLDSTVKQVFAGGYHSCAILGDQTVKCWGRNHRGQLGDGTGVDSLVPVTVTNLTGAIELTTGENHSCALTNLGGVYCWGRGFYGQLGNGGYNSSPSIVPVTGLTSGVKSIVAGAAHTCALTLAGGVQCWGYNAYGQIGNGANTDTSIPVEVSGLTSGVIAIAAGGFHTCALLSTGSMKCWGDNYNGQHGNGNFTDSNVPTDVTTVTDSISAIITGGAHTCIINTSGALKCFGYGVHGQLGDGTNTNSSSAVSVLNLPLAATYATAGLFHTCAYLTDNSVYCWGLGAHGQLGNGATDSVKTPTAVVGF